MMPLELSASTVWAYVAFAALGACVGSFVGVLAPTWSAQLLGQPGHTWAAGLWRRSACPHCQQVLRPWHLVPLLSYVGLRGRCAHCAAPIPRRDLAVEVLFALAWASMLWRWGWGWPALAWSLWLSVLLLMAWIDGETYWLPDVLTLGLMAVGLVAATGWGWPVPGLASWAGAALGYGLLWVVAWSYRRWRGREGLGMGDAKLLGALGAWLGPWALPSLLWLAAVLGLVWGLAWRWSGKSRADGAFPFGPALVLAGWALVLWPQLARPLGG